MATYEEVKAEAVAAGVGEDMIKAAALMVAANMEAPAIAALKKAISVLKTAAADVNHVVRFSCAPMRERNEKDSEDYAIPANSDDLTTINSMIAALAARISVYNAANGASVRIEVIEPTDTAPIALGLTSRKKRSAGTAHEREWPELVKHMIAVGATHILVPTGLTKGDKMAIEVSRAGEGDKICINPDKIERKSVKYVTLAHAARYAQRWNPATSKLEDRRWASFNPWQAQIDRDGKLITLERFYEDREIEVAEAAESQTASA